MTSYRSRSKSPQRRRSDSPEQKGANKLPQNVEEISISDYFMKNDEFRVWLKEEKDRVRSFYPRQPVLQIEQSSSISTNCPGRKLEGTSLVNVGVEPTQFRAWSYFRKFVKVVLSYSFHSYELSHLPGMESW